MATARVAAVADGSSRWGDAFGRGDGIGQVVAGAGPGFGRIDPEGAAGGLRRRPADGAEPVSAEEAPSGAVDAEKAEEQKPAGDGGPAEKEAEKTE